MGYFTVNANRYSVLAVMFMGFAGMSYGYSNSMLATTLGQPWFLIYFGLDNKSPSSSGLIGASAGIYNAGAFIGVFVSVARLENVFP
jgi:hypothetical protein